MSVKETHLDSINTSELKFYLELMTKVDLEKPGEELKS